MAFCHILSKFCVKILSSFQNIVNFRNAVEIEIKRDIDFTACDAYSIQAAITAFIDLTFNPY